MPARTSAYHFAAMPYLEVGIFARMVSRRQVSHLYIFTTIKGKEPNVTQNT